MVVGTKREFREQAPSGWERVRARRAAGTLMKDLREIRLLNEMEDYDTFATNSPVEPEERSKSVSFALPEPAEVRQIPVPTQAYEKLELVLSDPETRDSVSRTNRTFLLKGFLIILLVSAFLMFTAASLILILNKRTHDKTQRACETPDQGCSASAESEEIQASAGTSGMLFPSGPVATTEATCETVEEEAPTVPAAEEAPTVPAVPKQVERSPVESLAKKIKQAIQSENHDSESDSEPPCPGCEECTPKPIAATNESDSCDCSGSCEESEECSCSCSGSCESESQECSCSGSCDSESSEFQEAPVVPASTRDPVNQTATVSPAAEVLRKYHELRRRPVTQPGHSVQSTTPCSPVAESRVVMYLRITVRIFVVKPIHFVKREIKRDIQRVRGIFNYLGF